MEKTGKIFISNLKRLRRDKGLSQEQLAERVDLSLRGYQKYEQGESSPTPDILDRFSGALGCSSIDLMALEGSIHSTRGDLFRTLLSSLAQLSDKQLETIQGQIDSFLRAQGSGRISRKKPDTTGEG